MELNDTYTPNKAEFEKIFGTTKNLGNLIVRLSIAAHAFHINRHFSVRKFGIGWHQFLAEFTSLALDHILKTGTIPDDERVDSLLEAVIPYKPAAKMKPPRSNKKTSNSRAACPTKDVRTITAISLTLSQQQGGFGFSNARPASCRAQPPAAPGHPTPINHHPTGLDFLAMNRYTEVVHRAFPTPRSITQRRRDAHHIDSPRPRLQRSRFISLPSIQRDDPSRRLHPRCRVLARLPWLPCEDVPMSNVHVLSPTPASSTINEEDVTIERLCSLLTSAVIDHHIDDDGDIIATDGLECPLWIVLSHDQKLIGFATYYPPQEKATENAHLEAVNILNASLTLVQFSWCAPKLFGHYWMTYDTRLDPRHFIKMLRRFSSTFVAGVKHFQDIHNS